MADCEGALMPAEKKEIKTVRDVIETADCVLNTFYQNETQGKIQKAVLYRDTLKAIASRSQDEYARDMATEALILEDTCL
jgi:hypothetical protein